ncbi:hypothetical protein M8J76_000675 [Diaphorina citri]|nr:hypothetical protein M8J75_009643 [Diaphorina citri]KAI5744266.1 hypothetical protein M8J76_000675 [Diaphorina citri]KAI5750745.1 hypothetical protein M8J77_000955 [Diaphorina citri]
MLVKRPAGTLNWKRYAKRFVGIAIVGELASLGFTYFVWNKLNTDQEVRLYAYKNYKIVLDGYYMIGEKLSGSTEQRDTDLSVWRSQNKI